MHRSAALLCALLATRLIAQQAPPSSSRGSAPYDHAAAPDVRAARLTGSIHLDGHLDEAVWAAATPATTFTQTDPVDGAAPSKRTEVRVLIGDDAVYIGARMLDDPANIRPRLARHDESVDGDIFAVSFDSRHDHLSSYYFRVTAGGALRDAVASNNGQRLDLSWDAVWDAAVSSDTAGWSAEIRIPLSQLPYNRTTDPTWGIQFERYSWNKQERDLFAYTPKTEHEGVQRYGHLIGIGELPAPSRIELVPYVTTRAKYLDVSPLDPFRSRHDYFGNAGADLKLRVTSNFTLNGTVNPDFGQVEVDPAVVNLSAFETFFPEKRPFFVEGRELYSFGQLRTFNSGSTPNLFFSRRIGRQPQRQLDGVSGFNYVDTPEQATIAAAGKLTGKTGGGWSTALLEAVTTKQEARFIDNADTARRTAVEPLTNYFLGRVRKEMRTGNTVVGGLVTAVNRDLGDSVLATSLRSKAYVAGVDLNHAWSGQRWLLDASLAGSHVAGSDSAIARTQRSSARYYQRPDARSLRYDPTRTALDGIAGQLALIKASGLHWLGNVAYQHTSPGFESNDLGFQQSADRRAFSTDIAYQENKPGLIFRNYVIAPFTNQSWNSDGDLTFNNYAAIFQGMFRNFSGIFLRGDYNVGSYDDRLTRGGPTTRQPNGTTGQIQYFTDQRNRYLSTTTLRVTNDEAHQHSTVLSTDLRVQITRTFTFGLGPQYVTQHSLSQFITRVRDEQAVDTYGYRYVFAPLDYRELGIVTRVDWTFTPRLSFQLFAQPLVASGHFRATRELTKPRTFDFRPYTLAGLPNLDFNTRSLRGNAVLRWEYRPGSTLYLVWQQQRDQPEAFGNFDPRRDYRALISTRPDNIFAIKASYWIAR